MNWLTQGSDIAAIGALDPAIAARFFDTPDAFAIGHARNTTAPYGDAAGLTTNPVPSGYAATPVLKYESYAAFRYDCGLDGGTYRIPAFYGWVLYDCEDWAATPQAEYDDVWTANKQFTQLAHSHGLQVILTPARSCGLSATSVHPKTGGESLNDWYIRTGVAKAAANGGLCAVAGCTAGHATSTDGKADIVEVQDQANTILDYPAFTTFQAFYNDAKTQVLAGATIPVWCGISCNYGTAQQMAEASGSVTADGFWLNVIGDTTKATEYLTLMAGGGGGGGSPDTGERPRMPDSLVIAGQIELLGGGVASTHPMCAGAVFYLGRDWSLSAPQPASEMVASLLLGGERPGSHRVSNRTPVLPVVIRVPPTGDIAADRLTLAGARELLLSLISADEWPLTWTRDGGLPLVLDCFAADPSVIEYSLLRDRQLVSLLEISFQALPYGRSDTEESILFDAPAQVWDPPAAPVTLDAYGTAGNWLAATFPLDASMEPGTTWTWTGAGNVTVSRSAAQFYAGTQSMSMSSVAAGDMTAAHCQASQIATYGLPCQAGDTITGKARFRAATAGRSVNVGAQFYDATGASISTTRGSNATDTTTGWVQATVTATAPSAAAWVRLSPQVLATAGAAEVHYADDCVLDPGAVWSYDGDAAWTASTQTAVSGEASARWSRVQGDYPSYDHVLPAAVDITGRNKLALWVGLATSSPQHMIWYKGQVSFAFTLYDAAGNTLSIGCKRVCRASALAGKPHWQYVSAPVPQGGTGFDYTTVSRYKVEAWNAWDSARKARVLQAGAYFCHLAAADSSTGSAGTRGGWYTLPGVTGTAPAPVSFQAAPGPSSFSTTVEWTTSGTKDWLCPAGVNSIDKVEVWGAGGGGGGGQVGFMNNAGGGGGGGGEYAQDINVAVNGNGTTHYAPVVGAAGSAATSGADGGNGGDSYFAGTSVTTRGHGGKGGGHVSGTATGHGGSGSTAYKHYGGGDGYPANEHLDTHGGGGGGSAGTSGGGNDAGSENGANAVTGGGPGGAAGRVYSGDHIGDPPTSGPGGGGGGGAVVGDTAYAGGAGYAGKVKLSYGASGLLPLTSLLVHSPSEDAPAALSPLIALGTGTDIPNGSTVYNVPDVGGLKARFDGTYTVFLAANTWNTPANSRTLTVQIRQYPYSGGTAVTANIARTLTPDNDAPGKIAALGDITLPLAELPPGNTDAYYAVTVTSTNTSDRFYDCLLLDTTGQSVLLATAGTGWNSVWLDEPDHDRALGLILGSDADRDRAFSITSYAAVLSGGPMRVLPGDHNRLLVYSQQGCPAITASYCSRWQLDRLE